MRLIFEECLGFLSPLYNVFILGILIHQFICIFPKITWTFNLCVRRCSPTEEVWGSCSYKMYSFHGTILSWPRIEINETVLHKTNKQNKKTQQLQEVNGALTTLTLGTVIRKWALLPPSTLWAPLPGKGLYFTDVFATKSSILLPAIRLQEFLLFFHPCMSDMYATFKLKYILHFELILGYGER